MQIHGLEVPSPKDVKVAVSAVVLLKYMDSDGDIAFDFSVSDGITQMEVQGMLATAANLSMMTIMRGMHD